MRFKFFQPLVLLLLITCFTSAQTVHIGGIVNSYAAVIDIDFCSNKVTVDNTAGFNVGEEVLMIQMRGAQIITQDNPSYGDITDYNGCGNYEVNVIENITGNEIEFTYAIKRNYDENGHVQLVSLPHYNTAVVDSALKPKPWDGSSGGVIILQADLLILNDSISVKGKGFQGAALTNEAACINGGIGGAVSYSATTPANGGLKGEGVSTSAQPFARGKNANGGGGGNDHNTGGGGGSNYGSGGIGGTRSGVSNFSCPGPAPGVGGAALPYNNTDNRIFMGGGGGAGDENNTQGSPGANGGGIVIIIANTLDANSQQIKAGGDSVNVKAKSDAAGGGGAGGTVLLFVNSIIGNLTVDVTGGKGGNLTNGNDPDFCFGPGGGGGGGVLWLKSGTFPGNVNVVDTGGLPGHQLYMLSPTFCPFGTTNGAQRGSNGNTVFNLTIPYADTPYVQLTADACCDTTVCPNSPIVLTATGTATYAPVFSWSSGNSTATLTQTVTSDAAYTVTVSDHRGCSYIETLQITVLNGIDSVSLCCDTSLCAGGTVTLVLDTPAGAQFNYLWSSGQTSTSITQTVSSSQLFTITITDANNCSISQSAYAFVVNVTPPFTLCCDTFVCSGGIIQVAVSSAQNLSYVWSSGETTTTIQQQIFSPQIITITATDVNGCTGSSSVSAGINNNPPVVIVCCDTLVCAGSAVTLTVNSAEGATFSWSTGENTSVITPSIYSTQIVSVSATDINSCVATASVFVNVPLVQTNITAVPDTSILLGQSVQLSASGSSYFYSWNPADGLSASNIKNPIATPQTTTTYCVTATDQNNCTASDCYQIELLLPDVKIPDGFTPNGDGNNDYLELFPLKFAVIEEVRIYNRWGEVVFSATGNIAWGGVHKGKIQPSGSYVCVVVYSSSLTPGKTKIVSKDFVLIR